MLASVAVSTVDKKQYEGEMSVRLCNYTDVYYNDSITAEIDFMEATATPDQIERFAVRAGDVVITKDSETSDDIGRPAFVPKDLSGVVYGYHLAVYRPLDHRYGRFLKYAFDSTSTRAELARRTPGVTRVGLSQDTLRNLRIPAPSADEAQQIADYLDHETAEIDAFIADLRRSAELTSERTRSFASRQLDRDAAQSARETILGHVIDVNEGQVDPTIEIYADLPLIAPNHIESRSGRLLSLESARDQGAISGKYKVRAGQVLYSKIRPALMKATIAPCESLCAADMYAMDARAPWLTNEYLLEYLLSDRFEQYAVTMSDRVAMPKLNRDTLAHAPIRVPSADVQERGVTAIKTARQSQFEAIADINAAIALAKERRAALITAAVTGQIDNTTKQLAATDSIQTAIEEAR